ATSPAYSISNSFTVSYTASDVGSGLADVELWAKRPGAQGCTKVTVDSGVGIDNSFSYTAALGDGSYRFYTRAHDAAGNYEAVPATPTDTSTLSLHDALPISATSPAYSISNSFTVSYTASDVGSGLADVELWA